MTATPRLSLPLLAMSQAQKEVTHNEALIRLDALVQAACQAVADDPPGEPAEGEVWLVGDAPTGAWQGHARELAAWYGGWLFLPPGEGWSVYDRARGRDLRHDGTAWAAAPAVQIPTLANDWINYGAGLAGVRYRRDAQGLVTVEGTMQAGSDGVVFTLLEGYRPAEDLMFCCWSGGGPYRVDVRANGEVEVSGSNSVFSSLAGIQFQAEG